MKTEAAVLWHVGGEWQIEQIDLDPPQQGEVLVRMVAAGLCHSDEHLLTGDLPMELPVIGGHEGAGIVEAVGPGVRTLAPGDRVVTSFFPTCGTCRSCLSGRTNLCDNGAHTQVGYQILDGRARHHVDGRDLRLFCLTGSFGHHTVGSETSFIKIDDDIPLDKACLVSCGVTTGWGSAVYRAGVEAGDDVAIVGVGGLGSAAVQGARMAGAARIFAIDPVEFKREQAKHFGATHTAASIEEAFDVIRDVTHGQMCQRVVMTVGVEDGSQVGPVVALAGKRGRICITNMPTLGQHTVTLLISDLLGSEKEIVGTTFGGASGPRDVPKLLDLYRQGLLDLDSMITRTYKHSEINQGYQDMRDGKNIRGVILYDS